MTDAPNGNGKEKRKAAWWEIPAEQPADIRLRAVAYYRHSAQDRQENSIPIQREQVREWADDRDIEIVRESTDGQDGP